MPVRTSSLEGALSASATPAGRSCACTYTAAFTSALAAVRSLTPSSNSTLLPVRSSSPRRRVSPRPATNRRAPLVNSASSSSSASSASTCSLTPPSSLKDRPNLPSRRYPAGGVVSMGRGFKAASGPDPPAGRRAEPSFQQLDLYALAPVRRGAGQRADRVYDPAAAADDAARVVRGARHLDDEGAVGALGPHLQAIGLLYQVHEAVVDEV